MTDNQDLLKLNRAGFIPGPDENLATFMKRVDLTKALFEDPLSFFQNQGRRQPFKLDDRVKRPNFEWAKNSLLNSFDFTGEYFSAFFCSRKLNLIQGAATWILKFDEVAVPVLQFRKGLRKGSFLYFYDLEEILTHELCHFARAAFDEPLFEEIFAYFTSCSFFRRVFGPLVNSSKALVLFSFFFFGMFVWEYLSLLSDFFLFPFFFSFFACSTLFLLLGGLSKLFFKRRKFNKCHKNLFNIFQDKNKTTAVMFRLTDREISLFSKLKKEEILAFAKEEGSLRWKVLNLAYFRSFIENRRS